MHAIHHLAQVHGDYPEIEDLVDAKFKFPSLEALQRVQTADGDPREVQKDKRTSHSVFVSATVSVFS